MWFWFVVAMAFVYTMHCISFYCGIIALFCKTMYYSFTQKLMYSNRLLIKVLLLRHWRIKLEYYICIMCSYLSLSNESLVMLRYEHQSSLCEVSLYTCLQKLWCLTNKAFSLFYISDHQPFTDFVSIHVAHVKLKWHD